MTEKEYKELLSTCSKLAALADKLEARIEQLERENEELKLQLKSKEGTITFPSYPTYPPVNPCPRLDPFGPTFTCSTDPCTMKPGRVRIKSKENA